MSEEKNPNIVQRELEKDILRDFDDVQPLPIRPIGQGLRPPRPSGEFVYCESPLTGRGTILDLAAEQARLDSMAEAFIPVGPKPDDVIYYPSKGACIVGEDGKITPMSEEKKHPLDFGNMEMKPELEPTLKIASAPREIVQAENVDDGWGAELHTEVHDSSFSREDLIEVLKKPVKLPLLIKDARDDKWKAFLTSETAPEVVADTEEEFNQKLLEAGLTEERIRELRAEWETRSKYSDEQQPPVQKHMREQQESMSEPGIPQEKMREVTVPFPATAIREYFQDKSLFFIANYSESKLKGAGFLTYLSNINIPSDVKFNAPIGYDEYAEVMKAYMESINIVNCAGLHVMAAEMLLVAKGLPYVRSPYALPIDEKVIQMFIEEHWSLVENWLHFIDSTQVYALRSIKALNEFYNPEMRFPVVEDRGYVGANIAQLFRIPEFIAIYFSIENATYKLSYFRDQFEEYMFKNATLSKYFNSPNNFAALYFMHYASGLFKPEDINHGLFRIGVFDPNSEFYDKTPYDFRLQE